jgi:hypothetical protein
LQAAVAAAVGRLLNQQAAAGPAQHHKQAAGRERLQAEACRVAPQLPRRDARKRTRQLDARAAAAAAAARGGR